MTNEPRTGEEKRARWLVLAAAAHVVVFAVLRLVPVRSATPSGLSDGETTFEIVVEGSSGDIAPAPLDRATTEAVSSEQTAASEVPNRAAVGAIASSRPAASVEVGPASSGETAFIGPTGIGEGSASGFSATRLTPGQLGIGGTGATNPFLPKHEEREATNERRREILRGTGLARDTELGLGPEGPALSALSDGTRMSIAPLRGRAIFLVTSDREGAVASVDLIDSDGGGGWLDAGKLALEALKAKRFRVPRGANGLAMRIEVRSEMKLPNGQDAPVGVRHGESSAPELTLPDPSNLGARAQRVVKSRIITTDLL